MNNGFSTFFFIELGPLLVLNENQALCNSCEILKDYLFDYTCKNFAARPLSMK